MPPPLSTSSAPRVLGRYEVGGKVGAGGMANVYLGRGTSDEGHEELVALKVIRDEYGHEPRFLRMFSDEAKILARLSHPNIIRTIEYGITKDHRYIVMELLAGRTLSDVWEALVQKGEPLSLRLGAWICARIAEGLHAAHEVTDQAGAPLHVVHRDVNPFNVFLTHDGGVKLFDFGLAKARVRRTQSVDGIIKGKIPYLAPEQLSSRNVDRRIDIYALGTTLWELGTMRRLFKRDGDVETLRAIRDAQVPDPRRLVSAYTDDLYGIVLRALERDPDERYPTAEEMRSDLDDFVGDGSQMSKQLAELVLRLFPGEEAVHSSWARDAASRKVLATAPPPPLPIPTASSNLVGPPPELTLEDADIEVISTIE